MDDAPDKGGKPWIDPFTQSGQDYIRHIIDDAIKAGFQKIILQEVQFPEGYSLDMIDYGAHASDDKHAFLAQYIEQMTAYAAEQGVELSAMFPSSRLLGANTAMYFGDPAALVGERAVADLRIQSFGNGSPPKRCPSRIRLITRKTPCKLPVQLWCRRWTAVS